jgi:tetratricopeptide (TPR) repeat protein
MIRRAWNPAAMLLAAGIIGCGGDAPTVDHAKLRLRLDAGKAALRNGQFDRAMADFDEAIKVDPKSVEAHVERGSCFYGKGEYAKAIEIYNQVEQLNPFYAPTWRLRALARFEYGDHTGALADAVECAKRLPNDVDTLLTLSMIQIEANQPDQAIASCDAALALRRPQDVIEAFFSRSTARRMKKDLAGAEQDMRTYVAAQPTSALGHANLGTIYREQGKFEEATAALAESQRLNPTLPYSWYQWGLLFHDQGNDLGVVSSWGKLTFELAPRNHFYHNAYARFLLTSNRADCRNPEIGLSHALDACDLTDFKNSNYLDTAALCYAETGDLAKAIETQKLAIDAAQVRANPTLDLEAQLKVFEGKAAQQAGDLKNAAELLREAAKQAPDSPPTRLALAAVLLELNETADAHEHCTQALMRGPRNADAFALRAKVTHRQGDLASAIRDVEQGLKYVPAHLESLLTLGELQIEAKLYDQAIANAKLALDWKPTSTRAVLLVARANRLKKDYGEAAKYLDRTMRIDAESPAAYAALAELHFEQGAKQKAIENQKTAITKLPKDSSLKAEYEATLKKYENPAANAPTGDGK